MTLICHSIAALILAAGRSSRMGYNKLLIEIEGGSLIQHVVYAALDARVDKIMVVVGHEADKLRAGLSGQVMVVNNPSYAEGLSTSIKAGVSALPPEIEGVIICLADMPFVRPHTLIQMMASFAPAQGREIVVPMRHGRRGNPVLWGRRFFPALRSLSDDKGAKHLIDANREFVTEVEAADDGVLTDIDTPEALLTLLAALPEARS